MLGLYKYKLGNTLGSLPVVISAVYLGKCRWHKINGIELALYWLGGSVGMTVILTHVSAGLKNYICAFVAKYIFEEAFIGLILGILFSHIVMYVLIIKRQHKLSIAELGIYRFGSLIGLLIFSEVMFHIVLIQHWGFLSETNSVIFRISYASMLVVLMVLSFVFQAKRLGQSNNGQRT